MPKATSKHKSLPIVAVCLAWLVPGAGHIYLRRVTRGIIIFVTISATFWAGVRIGGVMTVDYERERSWFGWFTAEMLSGLHGLVGWQIHRHTVNRLIAEHPGVSPAGDITTWQTQLDEILAEEKIALVAPTATVARAYAGVAGLLNVMCMFDVLMLSLMGSSGEPKPKEAGAPQ
jgi:hypothetical protein